MKLARAIGKLATLAAACLVPLVGGSAALHAAEAQRPNIVFLMTDDQRWDNFGCYGRPEFRTEHIDRLSQQGVTFDNAAYAVAICMPSRVTMMTGRHASSHRVDFVVPNDYTLSQADFADSYPAKLKAAGYRTGFIGKFGFTVSETARRPNAAVDPDFKGQLSGVFDFFVGDRADIGFVGPMADQPEIWPADDARLKEIYREGRQGTGRTPKTGEAMLRFIETQTKEVPFCLSVSFMAVKHNRDADIFPPHFALFKEQQFSVPDNWVQGANPDLPKVVRDNWRGVPYHLQRSSTPELYQKLVRRFAAQGYSVDQQVGLLMAKLKESGLLENTVVIYTSDNGRFHGSHGLYDKALLYEESVKAPLIVYDGRVPEAQRGRRESALISSVDIAPTILSLAGIDPPARMQGRDFTPVLNRTQESSAWRDAVFMENLFLVSLFNARLKPDAEARNDQVIAENKSYRCRGVRTERYKYFVYYEHTPAIEELYDLKADPLEQQNLIGDPAHADVLNQLRQRTEQMYREAIASPQHAAR